MRAIGKLPKGVLILEFIGMMLLAVALLSVSDSLSPCRCLSHFLGQKCRF